LPLPLLIVGILFLQGNLTESFAFQLLEGMLKEGETFAMCPMSKTVFPLIRLCHQMMGEGLGQSGMEAVEKIFKGEKFRLFCLNGIGELGDFLRGLSDCKNSRKLLHLILEGKALHSNNSGSSKVDGAASFEEGIRKSLTSLNKWTLRLVWLDIRLLLDGLLFNSSDKSTILVNFTRLLLQSMMHTSTDSSIYSKLVHLLGPEIRHLFVRQVQEILEQPAILEGNKSFSSHIKGW
jgi:hypothetical protein